MQRYRRKPNEDPVKKRGRGRPREDNRSTGDLLPQQRELARLLALGFDSKSIQLHTKLTDYKIEAYSRLPGVKKLTEELRQEFEEDDSSKWSELEKLVTEAAAKCLIRKIKKDELSKEELISLTNRRYLTLLENGGNGKKRKPQIKKSTKSDDDDFGDYIVGDSDSEEATQTPNMEG